MDPRTFLPPRPVQTAAPPAVGAAAPPLPGRGGAAGPAVVAFLRHAGCPFAEATMRALREAAAGHPGIAWMAVSHAPEEATERWCAAVGGAGPVEIVADPERTIYGAWGVGRTTLGHFLGRRSLGAVAQLARQGIRNRHPVGTRWQGAGTFAVDAEGVVRWRHLPVHAGELPDLEAAVRALG